MESELSLLNSSRPSTLFNCSSCSSTISFSTSCALAPGQSVVMVISGSVTSGVSCTGVARYAMAPNNIARITPTVSFTGFSMEKRIRSIIALTDQYLFRPELLFVPRFCQTTVSAGWSVCSALPFGGRFPRHDLYGLKGPQSFGSLRDHLLSRSQ